jgi:hypothetical protein
MIPRLSRTTECSQEDLMSDAQRRYRAIKTALLQALPTPPTSHQAQHINTLAALICGIVGARHTHLPKIADAAPGYSRKRESRITRFRRWLRNPAVTYATYFLPFAQALLAALAHQPLLLIMDGSTVGRGCLALLLCVVYKGRALPLAWTVVRGAKGHFPETAHTALLAQLQPHLPPDATVIFLGDGEFDGTTLQQTLHDYGWHYTCRTAVNTIIWCGDTPVRFSAMGVQEDEIVAVPGVHVTGARYGPVMVLGVWEQGHAEPIYLVTNLREVETAVRYYQKRFRIETFFSDQKSRGFQLQKSHLASPERLARLLLAAALAYLWIIYLGVQAVRSGVAAWLDHPNRADLSLFQLGLSLLAWCLDEDRPIPVAFAVSLDAGP